MRLALTDRTNIYHNEKTTTAQKVRIYKKSANPFIKSHGPHITVYSRENGHLMQKYLPQSESSTSLFFQEQLRNDINEEYKCIDKELKAQLEWIRKNMPLINKYKAKYINETSIYDLRGMTVILDLDETLIHLTTEGDLVFHPDAIQMKGLFKNYYVLKRPYLDEFLSSVSQTYNIVIYTSSHKLYAESVLEAIGMKYICDYRLLCRENCDKIDKTLALKNLYNVSKCLDNVIMVDNSIVSFCYELSRGIYIKSYKGAIEDNELLKVLSVLKQHKHPDDFSKFDSGLGQLLDYHISIAKPYGFKI